MTTKPDNLDPGQEFIKSEILKTERRVFGGRILTTLFFYVFVSSWLSYVRETAAIWFLWILIIAQLLLYLAIFTISYRRAQTIGLKYFSLLPFIILAALGRVNDWEMVIIPGLIIVMLIISQRSKTLTPYGRAILQPSPNDLKKLSLEHAQATVDALNHPDTLAMWERRDREIAKMAKAELAQRKHKENSRKPEAKHLITLVSTEGKTSKEVTREVWDNYQKYKRVEAEVLRKKKAGSIDPELDKA